MPEQSYPRSTNDLWPPPKMYGLRKSWLAAQIARLTASGAPAGAAALPARRCARLPGTIGPVLGKMFASEDDTIAVKTAAQIRILGLGEYTDRVFGACPMPQRWRLPRKKSWSPIFLKILVAALAARWADSKAVGTKGNSRRVGFLWVNLGHAARHCVSADDQRCRGCGNQSDQPGSRLVRYRTANPDSKSR